MRELRIRGAFGDRDFISAASGLVVRDGRAMVVADDELVLATFALEGDDPGEVRAIFPGELPGDAAERKRAKPDLESLFALSGSPETALVAVPSGSRPNRVRGVLLRDGRPPAELDFSALFARLEREVVALNVEGAVEDGESILLFHRGNTTGSENAVIRLDRAHFARDACRGALGAESLRGVTEVPLGKVAGVPLGFGDAARDARGRVWFLASAEDTSDAYLDGAFAGAVLGRLDAAGTRVEERIPIAIPTKPEGLAFDPDDGRVYYIVTDADDPSRPAALFRARFE